MIWFNKLIENKKLFFILILGGIGLSLFVYSKNPFSGPILPCVFNKITGFYCPGCGMTRAVNSIFNLKFYQAFRFNALIVILPITLSVYYIAQYKEWYKISKTIMILMFIIVIGYGVARNMPRFRYLAPITLQNLAVCMRI